MSIFKQAAQKAESPASKAKTKKKVIQVTEDRLPGIDATVASWLKAKAAEAEKARMEAVLRPYALRAFAEQYKDAGERPSTFAIQTDGGHMVTFVPMDRFLRIEDEAHAEELEKAFGDLFPGGSIVETTTAYGFDGDVLARNLEAIEKAIEGADMPDEDKAALITATVSRRLRSGLLDEVRHVPVDRVDEVLQSLQPQIQLRK
jgi:hypothetical protein